MRRYLKKGIAVICALTMVAALVTGCGQKNDTVETTAAGTTAETTAETTVAGTIEAEQLPTLAEITDNNIFGEMAQTCAIFTFDSSQKSGVTYSLKNSDGDIVCQVTPEEDFTTLVMESEELVSGTYTLWCGDVQYAAMAETAGGMGMGGMMPGGMEIPEGFEMPEGGEMPSMGELPEGGELPSMGEMPEGVEMPSMGGMPEGVEMSGMGELPEGGEMPGMGELPEGVEMPGMGELPEGVEMPGMGELPEGGEIPDMGGMPQGGGMRPNDGQGMMSTGELSTEIVIYNGVNYFSGVSIAE